MNKCSVQAINAKKDQLGGSFSPNQSCLEPCENISYDSKKIKIYNQCDHNNHAEDRC